MDPINQSERKAAIIKFSLFLFLSCFLIFTSFLLYRFVPASSSRPAPPISQQENVDPAQVAELKQKLSSLAESMNQVNIMFLVDATRGMESHLPAVAKAAQQIEQEYPADMMAACYRDAAEGAWLYMTNEMVGEDPTTWLNSLDTEAKFDRDEPEALFYGLKRALESDYLQPQETNILILVGDAGNHAQEALTDVPPAEIVELLKNKNCHFAAFQARNPNTSPIYAEFSTQIIDDILEPVKGSFATYPFQEKDSVDAYGLSYQLVGKTKNLLYVTNPSKDLPPGELTAKINAFVAQVLSPLQQQVDQLESMAQGNYPSSLDQETIDLLAQHQITQDQLSILRR
ncbi:MAG: hypothetical protein RIG62_14865 [Cyclobacteriaceae bacterium]